MSSFFFFFLQKYCCWLASSFSWSHCQSLILSNLKWALHCFGKIKKRARLGVAPHCVDEFSKGWLSLPFSTDRPIRKPVISTSDPVRTPTEAHLHWYEILGIIWLGGGQPWVTTGSLAFHNGEPVQAAAVAAKKSAATGNNKTQTRPHCDCYLLLHNKPSHSLGWVSGVQPLSSRPAFDLGVEMRRGLVLSCGDRNAPPPGCYY